MGVEVTRSLEVMPPELFTFCQTFPLRYPCSDVQGLAILIAYAAGEV